jgi:hypothetical protein
MRNLFAVATFVLCTVVAAFGVQADDRTTIDEAKALALRGAEIVRAEGVAKAGKMFEDKSQPFFGRGDTYVFIFGADGTVHAHGGMPSLDGKNLIDLRDPTGKPLMREICGVKGEQWVDYAWKNPKTESVEKKTSYVVQVGDYVVGAGAYRN